MKCRRTAIIKALLGTLPRIFTTLSGLRNVVALVFALRTTSSITLCSPDEKLPNLNLTFFYSQEEEDAVAEADQEDWKTNVDTQVRLDHKVKSSGNLKHAITFIK